MDTPALVRGDALDGPAAEAVSTAPAVPGTARAPWRDIARWVALGTVVMLMLVLVDYSRYGGRNPVSFLQPGDDAVPAQMLHQDFPDVELPDGEGLDGQEYYAIARDPLHLDDTSENLDRPQYRLQHPLLAWAAWLLHPTGGGTALILALLIVCLVGVMAGAAATGYLSWRWGGPVWLAALFPLLPGSWWSMRTIASDALALGLVLIAIALADRMRYAWAVPVAVLAVLAKEPMVLVLGGWWLAHRTRRDLLLVLVPTVVAGAWMAWLRVQLPADRGVTRDLDLPFKGLSEAWSGYWSHGHELVSMACMLGGLAIGAIALWRRGLRHPLGWAIAVQLAFLLCMGINPTAMNFGGTRMAMPVMVLGMLALATPRARRNEPDQVSYTP